jgi:hypothetical protein
VIHALVEHFAHDVGWPATIIALAMVLVALLGGGLQWLSREIRLAERVLRRGL